MQTERLTETLMDSSMKTLTQIVRHSLTQTVRHSGIEKGLSMRTPTQTEKLILTLMAK